MYDATPEHPEGENIFYYLTVYNEPYPQPPEPVSFPGGPAGLEQGILRGLYQYASALGASAEAGAEAGSEAAAEPQAQILASGIALRQALTAQEMLARDWGVSVDVWSATSWTELRREALACESWNLLHPSDEPRVPYVTSQLSGMSGPVVAVSDWIKAVPDQIARWVPGTFTSPGGAAVLPRGRGVDHPRGAVGAGPQRRGRRRIPGPGHRAVPPRPPGQRGPVVAAG
jgi:pyruvate dehydrogenase E1 component